MAKRRPAAISREHGEEAARGPHLPRLPAQRPHGDRRGAVVAAGTAGCDGLDAADVGAGESRPGPEALHRPHRPALLAKTKAWADYCDGERPLEDAIKRLGKARLRHERANNAAPRRHEPAAHPSAGAAEADGRFDLPLPRYRADGGCIGRATAG